MATPEHESNPYQAPESLASDAPEESPRFSWRWMVGGALWSIGLSFPIAALTAFVYRMTVRVPYSTPTENTTPAAVLTAISNGDLSEAIAAPRLDANPAMMLPKQ